VVERLGLLAKTHAIYLVANILERDRDLFYNTAIAFDRLGTIVAR
jgi:hypothetical protein